MKALLIALALVAVVGIAPWLGGDLSGPEGEFILWHLRIPRVLIGVLAGGILSLTGAVYQGLFRNALATPSTVGTLAGATLGALASLVLWGGATVMGMSLTIVAAFIGAATVSFIIAAIAASARTSMHEVLLAGIAITLAAGAISSGLHYAADSNAVFAATQWSLGHLPQVGYRGVVVLAPVVAIAAAVLLSTSRGLQALIGGEDRARSQGVPVERIRVTALLASSLGVGATVAWCGPIAFVGLVVPHLIRLAGARSPRTLLPLSFVAGAAFLVASDTAARLLLHGRELPVGVITSAVGAPALIALIASRKRG